VLEIVEGEAVRGSGCRLVLNVRLRAGERRWLVSVGYSGRRIRWFVPPGYCLGDRGMNGLRDAGGMLLIDPSRNTDQGV